VLTLNEKVEITKAVKQTLSDYFADIKKNGLLAEFNYLDSSKEFFWVPPGYRSYLSYDSVVSILKSNAGNYKLIDNNWTQLHINPLGRNLASYTGKITSAMTDTTGARVNIELIESGIVIRRNDQWKLLSGQTALIKP
jgi:hypothetical protein